MSELDDLKDPEEETAASEPTNQDPTPAGDDPGASGEQDPPEADPPAADDPGADPPADPDPEQVPYSRFKEVYGKAKATERELEYWKKQAIDRQQTAAPGTKPTGDKLPDDLPPKPQFADYTDDAAYYEALAEWKLEEREARGRQEQQRNREAERTQTFQQKISEGMTKFEDFQDVAFLPAGMPSTDALITALHDSDKAADILYHFGKNRDEAIRIASLDPVLAAREIGKLEARFASKPAVPKKTNNQPAAPTSPVGGHEPPPGKREQDMTMEEWEAWYEKKRASA